MTSTAPDTLQFSEPEGIRPRGTLIVVPGRSERPELYERLGRRLAADAYRTFVTSAPTDDAQTTHSQIIAAASEAVAPLVLAGSDTGALFLAGAVAKQTVPKPAGLVLAGLPIENAGLDFDAWDWERELDARSTCVAHRARLTGSGKSHSSLRQPVPLDLLAAARFSEIDTPILALHGEDDEISPLSAVRPIYAQAPDVELIATRNGLHDVFNDGSHRTVAATLVLWLERLRAGDPRRPLASSVALAPEPARL